MAVDPQPPKAQGKTKAKARYLKRKKDRRKHRKAAQPAAAKQPEKDGAPDSGEDNSGDDDDGEDSENTPVIGKKREPPRKRRKLSSDDEVNQSSSSDSPGSDDEIAKPSDNTADAAPRARSPTPVVVLPSFPLPIAPDAPSKATLALQGLDKALLGAELVDPTYIIPLDGLDAGRSAERGDLPVISEKMKNRLRELGISEFFAVQTALLPFLLPPRRRHRAVYCPYDPPRDVCASAPTGSGKTLAYVVPIVEILSMRIATRLRALVVLPTRDLVQQVQETFEAVSKGRGLKIGVATGQHSFAHEQAQLVADQSRVLHGGSSKVDILICTPGRLIDHLAGTRNFTLQHLRFLVVDEADRLLAQSFQDWLAQVLAALRPPSSLASSSIPKSRPGLGDELNDGVSKLSLSSHPDDERQQEEEEEIPYHDAVAPHFLASLPDLPHTATTFDDPKHVSCQKLLFSATLTRDPARIAALGLRDAKYFIVQDQGKSRNGVPPEGEDAYAQEQEQVARLIGMEGFAMPSGLTEHFITTSPSRKPLMLFHLVHTLGVSNALVFTKSAESTARLVRLFEFFEESYASSHAPSPDVTSASAEQTEGSAPMEGVQEGKRKKIVAYAYSSDLAPGERRSILEKFKSREIDILVCSDLISRGIDIPSVPHVVSYDTPVDLRKYVHRVGRTARAGRTGDAWTLVEDQEARFFKAMMRETGHLEKVKKVRVRVQDVEGLEEHYNVALERLRQAYSRS